ADAGAEARLARDHRQALGIEPCQPRELRRRQRLRRDIPHMAGEVADRALAVEKARLLRADLAIAHELHGRSSSLFLRMSSGRYRSGRGAQEGEDHLHDMLAPGLEPVGGKQIALEVDLQ